MVRPVTIFGSISYWGTGTQTPEGPRLAAELSRRSQHLGSVEPGKLESAYLGKGGNFRSPSANCRLVGMQA